MSDTKTAAPELRMSAYYYGFEPTGVPAVDLVLSAVACAGKASHETADWRSEARAYDGHTGSTPVEWIQKAATAAADEFRALEAPAAASGAETQLPQAVQSLIAAYGCDTPEPHEPACDPARDVISDWWHGYVSNTAGAPRGNTDTFRAGFASALRAVRALAAAPAAAQPEMRPAGWLIVSTGAGGQLCAQHYENEREAQAALPHHVGGRAVPCYVPADAAPDAAQPDELRRAVRLITGLDTALIDGGEWAEPVSDDTDAQALETAIAGLRRERDEMDAILTAAGWTQQADGEWQAPAAAQAQPRAYHPDEAAVRRACDHITTVREAASAWGGWSGTAQNCDAAINLLRYGSKAPCNQESAEQSGAAGATGEQSATEERSHG